MTDETKSNTGLNSYRLDQTRPDTTSTDVGSPSSFGPASTLFHALSSVLFTVGLAAYLTPQLLDLQFYHHLLNGSVMLDGGELLRTDRYTAGAFGNRWIVCGWLFDVVLALFERLFSGNGLYVLRCTLSLLTVAVVFFCFVRVAGERFFGAFLTMGVLCAILPTQSYGPPILVPILWSAGYVAAVRQPGKRSSSGALALAGVSMLAANFDPCPIAWVLGMTYFVLSRRSNTAHESCSISERGKSGVDAVVGILLGQLCTPYLGGQLLFSAVVAVRFASFYLVTGSELGTVFDYSVAFLLLFWLAIAALGGVDVKDPRGRPVVVTLIASSMLSLLALAMKPLLPFALLLTGFAAAECWRHGASQASENSFRLAVEQLRSRLAALPAIGSIWILFCIAFVNAMSVIRGQLVEMAPSHQVSGWLDSGAAGPVLHPAELGAYLSYRLHYATGGKIRPQLDWRAPALDAPAALSDWRLSALKPGWEEYADSVSPKAVIVSPFQPLFSVLERDVRWRRLPVTVDEVDIDRERRRRHLPQSDWAVFICKEERCPFKAETPLSRYGSDASPASMQELVPSSPDLKFAGERRMRAVALALPVDHILTPVELGDTHGSEAF